MTTHPEQPQDRAPRRSILSVLSRLFSLTTAPKERKIIRTNDGFTLSVNGYPNWSLRWDQVTGVVAYKRALINTDQICFGFRIGENQLHLRCIDEDTLGFKSVEDDISTRTDGAWPAVFTDVAWPPFGLCWTVLWTAQGSDPIQDNPILHMIDPPIG